MSIKLRKHAEERLTSGTAPATQDWPTGAQALTLLHNMASAPASASEALKLLHELQVHQVELDLQHEEAEHNRSQLTSSLDHYTGLFELAPFAYLVLNPEGQVIAANRVAAAWLAVRTGSGEESVGCPIETLLAPGSRAAIRDLLGALRRDQGPATTQHRCTVQANAGGALAQVVASAVPDRSQVLLAFMPVEPASGH